MVFIEAETDPFTRAQQQMLLNHADAPTDVAVRRPLRGIEVRDPTYSYMRVVTEDGKYLLLADSSGPATDGIAWSTSTANYLIQALTFVSSEKFQLIPTFGETYVLFFGQQPIQAQITGALLNTADFPWSDEMWRNYNELMRGTKLAERKARLFLYYDGVLLEGYPTSYQPNQTSDAINLVPFNMTVLVSSIELLGLTTSPDFPVRRQPVDLSDPQAYEQLSAMSAAERSQYLEQLYGSQRDQLEGARSVMPRQGRNADSELGMLMQSAAEGNTQPPGAYRPGVMTLDQFLQHGNAGPYLSESSPFGIMRSRITPLRSRIYDNVDEYLLRPTLEGFPDPVAEESLSDGEAMAEAMSNVEEDELPTESRINPSFGSEDSGEPSAESILPEDTGSLFGTRPGGPPSHGSTAVPGHLLPADTV